MLIAGLILLFVSVLLLIPVLMNKVIPLAIPILITFFIGIALLLYHFGFITT